MGRKSRWSTHIEPKLDLIKAWYSDDCKEFEIATRLGVSISTFEKAKREHQILRECLLEARSDVNYKVQDSLKRNALGGFLREQKIVKLK